MTISPYDAAVGQGRITDGATFRLDYGGFLSQDNLVYLRPAERPYGGMLLGNGDVGMAAWGEPDRLTYSLGKNDLWDRRLYSRFDSNVIRYAELLERVKAGRTDALPDDNPHLKGHSLPSYQLPFPCPKPAGEIILHAPLLREQASGFFQRLSLYDALHSTTVQAQGGALKVDAFVSAEDNLVAFRVSAARVLAEGLRVELFRRADSIDLRKRDGGGRVLAEDWRALVDDPYCVPIPPAASGHDGRYFWVVVHMPADTTYPEGFDCVLFGLLSGVEYQPASGAERAWADIALGAGANGLVEFSAFVACVTTRDASDPMAEAKRLVDEAAAKGYEAVFADHSEAWHDFWSKSFVQLSDEFMTNMWYLHTYLMRCCAKPEALWPGLYGNWIFKDEHPWHSDYHFDYNCQQPTWGLYSSNHPELAAAYYDLILNLLPYAQRQARERYEMPGAKYPIVAFPIENPRMYPQNILYDFIMCLSAWVAQPFWWHYQYTQDVEFLREKGWPVISECARFTAAYLRKHEDGLYHVDFTISPEHWGITKNAERNRDCAIDLALAKFILRAAAQASQVLGRDEGERRAWEEIADHLAPYPTSADGSVFVDVAGAPPITYNYRVPMAPVFPGEDIGLDSQQYLRDLAVRTLQAMRANGNNDYITRGMANARMALPEAYRRFREDTLRRLRPNGPVEDFIGAPDDQFGVWVENLGAAGVIDEYLMRSVDGRIRLFPGLPPDIDARFAGLRAVGAFLVASERAQGRVTFVTIRSETGKACEILNPWQGETVQVRDLTSAHVVAVFVKHPGFLRFPTAKGHLYRLDPPDAVPAEVPATLVTGRPREAPRGEGLGLAK